MVKTKEKTGMRVMRIGDLKEDHDITSRRRKDGGRIRRFAVGLRNKDKFPPPVVDTDGHLAAGYHTWWAMLKVFGPDHKTKCEVREMGRVGRAIVATDSNLRHGGQLTMYELGLLLFYRRKLGDTEENIEASAAIMHSHPDMKVTKVFDCAVWVRDEDTGEVEERPVKPPLAHLKGTEMSGAAYREHRKDAGSPPWVLALQIKRWLDRDQVDMDDPRNIEALWELKASLNKALKGRRKNK